MILPMEKLKCKLDLDELSNVVSEHDPNERLNEEDFFFL